MYGLGNSEMALEVAYEALMAVFNLVLFLGVWYRKERCEKIRKRYHEKTTLYCRRFRIVVANISHGGAHSG